MIYDNSQAGPLRSRFLPVSRTLPNYDTLADCQRPPISSTSDCSCDRANRSALLRAVGFGIRASALVRHCLRDCVVVAAKTLVAADRLFVHDQKRKNILFKSSTG